MSARAFHVGDAVFEQTGTGKAARSARTYIVAADDKAGEVQTESGHWFNDLTGRCTTTDGSGTYRAIRSIKGARK